MEHKSELAAVEFTVNSSVEKSANKEEMATVALWVSEVKLFSGLLARDFQNCFNYRLVFDRSCTPAALVASFFGARPRLKKKIV